MARSPGSDPFFFSCGSLVNRATHAFADAHPAGPHVQVYSIPEGRHGRPDATHPVLLSYIDVVVQGYLREFGEVDVQRFFETTDGWDGPVPDDRTAPICSRHQMLSSDERTLVDDWLQEVGARAVTQV